MPDGNSNTANSNDTYSPVREMLAAQTDQKASVAAMSNAAVLTLGVMALAPLLESLMAHMATSADSRRQALLLLNKSEQLGLINMAQELGEFLNQKRAVNQPAGGAAAGAVTTVATQPLAVS